MARERGEIVWFDNHEVSFHAFDDAEAREATKAILKHYDVTVEMDITRETSLNEPPHPYVLENIGTEYRVKFTTQREVKVTA